MGLDNFEFGFGQAAGLIQNIGGNGDFSEIMDEAAIPDSFAQILRKSHLDSDQLRQFRHAPLMAGRVGVVVYFQG